MNIIFLNFLNNFNNCINNLNSYFFSIYNNFVISVIKLLVKLGYLVGYKLYFRKVLVFISLGSFNYIKFFYNVSKHIFLSYKKIKLSCSCVGFLSSSIGVLSFNEALKFKIGGVVLFYLYL